MTEKRLHNLMGIFLAWHFYLQNRTHFFNIRHRIMVHDHRQFEENIQNENRNALCHD